MIAPRFFALLATGQESCGAWRQASAVARATLVEFDLAICRDRLAVLTDARTTFAIADHGFVVGDVFRHGDGERLIALDADQASRVIASDGERLVRDYWGSYVALFCTSDGRGGCALRAPFGDLSCVVAKTAYGLAIASDVALLELLTDFTPEVDWDGVVQHLAVGELYGRRTALSGLRELLGGERLTLRGGCETIDTPWCIWKFAGSAQHWTDRDEAIRRVRDAVTMTVVAQAGRFDQVVLRLSGGLDSSVVAACLAKGRTAFSALTMVTRDRAGDERNHARAVAAHFGIALAEVQRDVRLVDVTTSAARGLPRPSARSFVQASHHAACELARQTGATAIVDGGGGDHVFAGLQSCAPVADCLAAGSGLSSFWRTAGSIGIAAGTSTFEVARRAIVRHFTRGPAYRWATDVSLLSPAARQIAEGTADHPWLRPPHDMLAGSAAHVALAAAAQSILQGRDRSAPLPLLSPLVAQPIVETCLRVPSWWWTSDGHDRMIARDAFRDALPPTIVNRRDKGAPDSFQIELVEGNRELIWTMLTEGELAEHGIVDVTAVRATLDPTRLAKGAGCIRLMQLVDVEAWARSWR